MQGNFIGTNAAGALLGNDTGIFLQPSSTNNTIGGSATGQGNVIGHCRVGMSVYANDNLIQGNFIGISPAGLPLPNTQVGIAIHRGSNNAIGGTDGPGNRIAFNGGDGITIFGAGVRNAILGNSIFANGSTSEHLGIDLDEGAGLTPNDPGDADTGPNEYQNYPVLTSVTRAAGNVTIGGTLNSQPNSPYRLEFFRTSTADSTRSSEGQTFLGFTDVTTDGNGDAAFIYAVLEPLAPSFISATATDANGNTSEFSAYPDPLLLPELESVQKRLLNTSTRLAVQTGDNVLIGGFIITGNSPKRMLVRAIGPSLTPVLGSAVLRDPVLEIYQGGSLLLSNDNWRATQEAEIRATKIPPSANAESAILGDFAPGAFTAVVRGNHDTTGIALVEAYDLARGTNAKLANISTRGLVQTGDKILIGGFIVGSESNRWTRILVRGIGPSLAAFGVPNSLQDPVIMLVNQEGAIVAQNDNWRQTQEAEIQASELAPLHDNEAAIMAPVIPGNYTAVLRGSGAGTGVGLVEVYDIP